MTRLAPEDYTNAALAQAEHLAGADEGVLATLRAAGREALASARLPGPKSEAWKYSRVTRLLEDGLLDRPVAGDAVDVADVGALEAVRITLVDGVPQLPAELPDGVSVARFSALAGDAATDALTRLDSLAPAAARPFVALNAALAEDGVLIRVAADTVVRQPLELLFAQGTDPAPCGAHPRVLLHVEHGAQVQVIEREAGAHLRFTNSVIEAFVDAGARLDHIRLALDAGEGRWLTALDVAVAEQGHYGLHQALLGAAFRRAEIRLHALGPGAHIEVGGATLTRDRSHLDVQMCIEHAAAHCSSNQVFRSIAGERSRTVLNGRIHIHRDAQKTAAQFSTRNLLLSAGAEIDAKPELEIYADDVTCAHGATVGRLDETALFYLRSRGIDEDRARAMLAFAFLGAVVDAFPVPALAEAVRARVEAAFSAAALEVAA